MDVSAWAKIGEILLDVAGPAIALLLAGLAIWILKKFGVAPNASLMNILLKRAYSLVGILKNRAATVAKTPSRAEKVKEIADRLKLEADRLGLTHLGMAKLYALAENAVDQQWSELALEDKDNDGIPDIIDPEVKDHQ